MPLCGSKCTLPSLKNKERLSVFAEGNTLRLIRAVNQPIRVQKQAVCWSCHLNNNKGGWGGDGGVLLHDAAWKSIQTVFGLGQKLRIYII